MTLSLQGEWLRGTLYGSPAFQFLASVAVITSLVLLLWLVRSLRDVLGEKYTLNFAEAVEMVVLATGVVGAAFLLSEIWALSFVFDRAIEGVVIDRWTGIRTTMSVALLVSGYLLVRGMNRSLDRVHTEGAITTHQKEVAYHILDVGVFAVIGLAILSVWGIAPTNVVLGASVVTAVLGLAAQKTVASIISGFLLLFSRPFRAGDWIETAGEDGASGIVQDVTITHTKVRTFNDEHALIPNDELTANQLINYSRSDRMRIDVEIGVDYETDLDRAREVVKAAVEDVDAVSVAKQPKVVLKRFGDSAIVLELQFWIENPDRRRAWRAQTAVITAVKSAFDREGIAIPFPQRTHSPRSERGFGVETSAGTDRTAADHQFEAEREAEDD